MKTKISSLKKPILMLALCILCGFFTNAYAKDGYRIANKVAETVSYLESEYGQTVASIQIDQLSKSSTIRSYTRHLYSGNDYIATSIGDNNFNDIDMIVYRKVNGQWIEVGRDADSSKTAIVQFKCSSEGEYKFEVKAYSFASDCSNGYYGFILTFDN